MVAGVHPLLCAYEYPVLLVRDDDLVLFNTPPPGSWVSESRCIGVESSVFFPKAGSRPTEAILICSQCVVRVQCAEYALENNQHWGVWGGLTERQRFAVKKFRRQGVVHPLDPVRFDKP